MLHVRRISSQESFHVSICWGSEWATEACRQSIAHFLLTLVESIGNNGYPLKNIKNIILSKKSHTTATIYPLSIAKKNMLYNFPRRVYRIYTVKITCKYHFDVKSDAMLRVQLKLLAPKPEQRSLVSVAMTRDPIS